MVQQKRDLYETLGIAKGASDEDIRKAYRRLAMTYHPDRNKNADAADRFKEVSEAYQVLSDPQKRAQYDRFGHSGVGAGAGRGFDGSDTAGGFGDIFDAFFGGFSAGARPRSRRGADLQTRYTIAFEEAVFGCEKQIDVGRVDSCHWCNGNGAEPGTRSSQCSNCRGQGQVRRSHPGIFGAFTQVVTCAACHGAGQILEQPCKECRGHGRSRQARRLAVRIPAGVEHGSRIRLSGEGDAGERAGRPGDLYVVLSVTPHKIFRREQNDLVLDLPISFAQAALGDRVEIQTLDGEAATLDLPAGIQSGAELTLKGKGVPHLEGKGRGNLRAQIQVVTPTRLGERQRELLQELAKSLGDDMDGREKPWFSRIKDAFGSSP